MEASSPFTFAIIGLILGFIIGLGCYRLLGKTQREYAAIKQTLLERERQIAELKKSMGNHVTNIKQRLENIRDEADQLEQQLEDDAAQWQLGSSAPKPIANGAPVDRTENNENPVNMPRDYADGKGGTLSEDFGLKESAKAQNDAAPQPPRY